MMFLHRQVLGLACNRQRSTQIARCQRPANSGAHDGVRVQFCVRDRDGYAGAGKARCHFYDVCAGIGFLQRFDIISLSGAQMDRVRDDASPVSIGVSVTFFQESLFPRGIQAIWMPRVTSPSAKKLTLTPMETGDASSRT